MKKTLIIVLGVIAAFCCMHPVQSQDKPDVLIGDDVRAISGFGGPMFQLTQVGNKMAVMSGGGGAVIFNNMMYFGGYGLGLATDLEKTVDGIDYEVDYNHGGFFVGYIFKPIDVFHMGFSTKLGWGDISIYEKDDFTNGDHDNIFVFQPQIEGELNITQWFKLNGAVGFNGVVGVSNDFYKPIDFNRPQASLSLLFGWFY